VEGQVVFAGISQGFRAPNLTNLVGASDRGSSGNPAQGNPQLDPEKSLTGELGWKWQAAPRYQASVTGFYTRIDDLIQRVFIRDIDGDGSIDGETVNAESAYLFGGELYGEIPVPYLDLPGATDLTLVGSLSHVNATVDQPQADGTVEEENISRANRTFGFAGVKLYHEQAWGLLQVRYSLPYDETAPRDPGDVRLTVAGDDDGAMPGYAVLDLRGGWENLDQTRFVTVTLENVFNHTYREPGSGLDYPGRNVVVSVGARW
jgi:outer membrane receptor protein involved in Fe transport